MCTLDIMPSDTVDVNACHLVGKPIWTLHPSYLSSGTLAAPAVIVPDVDGDRVNDLVILAIGETQVRYVT